MRYSQEDDYDSEDDENLFKGSEDEDFDEDYFDEMMDQKYHQDNQKIKIMKFLIQQQKLRRKLLIDSIKTVQKSFWWNFCNFETRLNWISKTYEKFSDLVFGPKDEEKETEGEDDAIL